MGAAVLLRWLPVGSHWTGGRRPSGRMGARTRPRCASRYWWMRWKSLPVMAVYFHRKVAGYRHVTGGGPEGDWLDRSEVATARPTWTS